MSHVVRHPAVLSLSWPGVRACPGQVATCRRSRPTRWSAAAAGKLFSVWTSATQTTPTLKVAVDPGRTVCVRGAGVDALGNTGAHTSPVCRTAPVDDKSGKTAGKVNRVKGIAYFAGSTTTSSLGRRPASAGHGPRTPWSCRSSSAISHTELGGMGPTATRCDQQTTPRGIGSDCRRK